MKLSFIKMASIMLMSGIFVISSAYAETSKKAEVSYTNLTGEVVLQGEDITPGSKVTIEILNIGAETPTSDADIRYLAECTADSDGKWKKSFIFNSESGKYPVRIYIADDNKVYEETLDFVSIEQLKNIIEEINNNPQQMSDIVRENVESIGVRSKAYNTAEENNLLEKGFEICKKYIPFKEVTDFQNSLKNSMTLVVFNNVKDAQTLANVADDSMDILNFGDEKAYTDWRNLSDKQRSEVCRNMKKSGYGSTEDIKYDLIENLVLYKVKNTTEWNGIAKTAKEYADLYKDNIKTLEEIDFSTYNSLSGERRYQAITELKKNYASIGTLEEWKNRFNTLCKKWKTATLPSNGSNGGSGGSGGGSSSSGKGSVSSIVAVTPNNTNNIDNSTFNDLENVPWAKEAIEELAKRGIVSGKEEGIFDTQSNVTREEFVKMLTGALGLNNDNSYECSFNDVDKEQWYYKYVACAEKYGITEGNGNGEFGIGKPITRQEMAAMVLRAAKVTGLELNEKIETAEFLDYDDISEWAKEACTVLQKAGIINGMEDGRFLPHENATRAQTAVMIYNML